jgi:DNA-binding IclR family transcriptional regulator
MLSGSVPASTKRRGAGRRDGGVQVIARAADILRTLDDAPAGLSLSEIAERVGLAKSTVHRLVVALEAEGFLISASPNGRVRLGPGLAVLAAAATGDLVGHLRPHLLELFTSLEETVDLAVLDGDHVLFIDQIAAPRRLRAVSAIGARFPLHCTANGKALLAALPRQEARRLLPARLPGRTPATITSRTRLWEELDEARRTGVAYDREEHTVGICAVGASVRDRLGHLVAITVVVPTHRFTGNERRLADRLLEARDAAQAELEASRRSRRSAPAEPPRAKE